MQTLQTFVSWFFRMHSKRRPRLDVFPASLHSAFVKAASSFATPSTFFIAYQGGEDQRLMSQLGAIYEEAAPDLRSYVSPHMVAGDAAAGSAGRRKTGGGASKKVRVAGAA